MRHVSGNGWSANVSLFVPYEVELPSSWTVEELKEFSTKELIQLCRDYGYHLSRQLSADRRVNLNGLAGFKEVVFLSDGRFVYNPSDGKPTREVRPNSETGALKGIGKLSNKDYRELKRATYFGLAKLLLVKDDGKVTVEEFLRLR